MMHINLFYRMADLETQLDITNTLLITTVILHSKRDLLITEWFSRDHSRLVKRGRTLRKLVRRIFLVNRTCKKKWSSIKNISCKKCTKMWQTLYIIINILHKIIMYGVLLRNNCQVVKYFSINKAEVLALHQISQLYGYIFNWQLFWFLRNLSKLLIDNDNFWFYWSI